MFIDELEIYLTRVNRNRSNHQGTFGSHKNPLDNNLYAFTISGFERNNTSRLPKYFAVIKYTELDESNVRVNKYRNEYNTHPYIQNTFVELSNDCYSKENINYDFFREGIIWLDEYRI